MSHGEVRLNERPERPAEAHILEAPAGLEIESNLQALLQYEPLDVSKSEIRLLTIDPGPESSPIRCTLEHASCAYEYPEYTAVSYCWGDSTKHLHRITVNGCTVSVTRNLNGVLRELRRKGLSTPTWVDALCINQADTDERGHQILRMKDIYSKTASTVVWLGTDESEYAELAFKCIRLLAKRLPQAEFDELRRGIDSWRRGRPTMPRLIAFRKLLDLSYWKRTWIIQELVLSRNTTFLWGQLTIDFETFTNGLETFKQCKSERLNISEWALVKGILRLSEAMNEGGEVGAMSLHRALSYSALSKSTDSRDKIFGILGLCFDGPVLIPSPDYSQPLDLILRELRVAELRIGELGQSIRRDVKSPQPMDLICVDSPEHPKRDNFPSWVTDWSALWSSPMGDIWTSEISRGLNVGFLACGKSKHVVKLSEDGLVLTTRGYMFDTIQQLSRRDEFKYEEGQYLLEYPVEEPHAKMLPQHNPYGSPASTYEAIWRTLVWDRRSNARMDKAPAEYGPCFQNLYSNECEAFLAKRSRMVQTAVALARGFLIHGWTLQEWTQFRDEQASQFEEHNTRKKRQGPWDDIAVENTTVLKEFILKRIELGRVFKRMMTTEKSYIGLAHHQSEVGDKICLLQGCTVPMILRPCEGGYRVVGECYVHGIMDGEFWAAQDATTMQDFHLR